MLQSMGSHRAGHKWMTEQQQSKLPKDIMHSFFFLNFGLANNFKIHLKKKKKHGIKHFKNS